MPTLCADLAAEHAALDALVAPLDAAQWETPTPAPGWTVRDQIGHLTFYDEVARLAAAKPEAFRARWGGTTLEQNERHHLAVGRGMRVPDLLAWWRAERAALLDALDRLDAKTRIAWFGPAMGALAFATARLMETWAHGQDVADALGIAWPASERLRHIAHLGVLARPYSYTAHGRTPPHTDVRVELAGPNGATWIWGDAAAADRICGPAQDFCLVVTQRRHLADTALEITGATAREWMAIAQAFAGPPGAGRRPGQFPRVIHRAQAPRP